MMLRGELEKRRDDLEKEAVFFRFKTQKKSVLARSGKSALKKIWVLASPENDDFTELGDSLSQNTLESWINAPNLPF